MIQLVLTIWGIVILVKRRVGFTKKKVVTGMPAIAIGILFVSMLPVGFILGMALGFVFVAQGISPDDTFYYAIFLDLGLLVSVIVAAFIIANIYGKNPNDPTNANPN